MNECTPCRRVKCLLVCKRKGWEIPLALVIATTAGASSPYVPEILLRGKGVVVRRLIR